MSVKVSVVVPVYGTEQYLRKCLDSLVGQTLKEMEILVVNDGSLDNSQAIIDEYEKKYSQVHGFQKENGGMSDARNYGIEHASGEYIAFVDSDDYIELDMYEIMYDKAIEDGLDIVLCDTFMEYPTYSYIFKADLGYTKEADKAYVIAYPNPPARLVRAKLMKEHLFRKDIWYEDLELMPRLVVYTAKIGFVNRALYHYLQREGSIMHQSGFRLELEDIFVALQNISVAYKENGLYDKYYKELEYLYIIHLQRSAVLRFVGLKGAEGCLKRVNECMKEEFPMWLENPYLKQSSWKLRLICLLGHWKQYWVISLLKRFI